MFIKMKNFLTSSILVKLILGFLLITIPLYSICIATLWISSTLITQTAQKSIEEKMFFFMRYLDKELQSVSQMLVALNNDPDISDYILLQDEKISYEKVQSENGILTKMNIIYYSSSYVDDVFILFPRNGQQLSLLKRSSAIDDKGQSVVARITKSKTRLERFAISGGLTYTIVFPDVYSVSNQVEYILGVDINQSRILDGLKTLQSDSALNVFLVETETKNIVGNVSSITVNQSVYDSMKDKTALSMINAVEIEGERYLVQANSSADGVFSLISYVKEKEIQTPVFVLNRLFWIFVGCSLLFISVFSIVLFRQIQRPLNVLVHYMGEIEKGNLNINFDQKRGDEYGYVYKQFNKMTFQLRTLIEEVLEKKIQLQQSQLRQLQSQINPHFLFNCFYIGYRMAKDGENENVANLCKYLGDYFRFVTKQAQDLIPLGDELRFTITYLNIQKIRFPTKLFFHIQEEEGVDSVLIPGLTIQTLVENSILHGFDNVEGPVNVEVNVRMVEGNVHIEVLDNGIGMTENALQELKDILNLTELDSEHCGLWNVHYRLRHNFKSQSGLLIEAREGGGLRVSFIIPSDYSIEMDGIPELEEGV